MKAKADKLALLGKLLDPEDLTERILAGLSEDYKLEIDAVNGRDAPISYTKLHERLLNREAMILYTGSVHPGPITTNVTDTHPRQNWKSNNTHNNRNNVQHHNTNRAPRSYLGRCQACGIQCHNAKYCPEFWIIRGTGSTTPWQSQQQN